MLKNFRYFLGNRESRTVGFLFAVSSLLLGIWVAALPQIKTRLGFTDASLGISLLLAPLGALNGVAIATKVFQKIAVGKWMIIGHIALSFIFVMEVLAPNRAILWIGLYLNGLIGFLNGVSTNATVDLLEKKQQKHLMSTSHGMYSIGGFISAALATVFYSLHLAASVQIVLMAVAIVLIIVSMTPHLLRYKDPIQSATAFRLPSRNIAGLAFICFVCFMGEGCIADWSAIYLKESLHGSKTIAGLGFAGFSIAMAIGRLNGDRLIPKWGSKRLVVTGSLIAASGFLIAISFSSIPLAIAGFTIIGIGFCCIVPILFSAAANVPGLSAVSGISAVASGGLIGFLAGPTLIGLISERFNMALALSLLFFLASTAALVAGNNKFLVNGKKLKPVNYPDQLM